MIPPRVLAFAVEQYERVVADLLDDPSWLFDEPEGPARIIGELRALGDDLGLEFDEVCKRGTPYEIERLQAIEAGRPVPGL